MPRRAVVDTSPIITFARANYLELLQSVVPELLLPPAVFRELTEAGRSRPGSLDVAEWGVQHEAPSAEILKRVPPLGAGEREAIALALELELPVLLDEVKARQAAQKLGVSYFGSLRVLATAKSQGLIPLVKPVLDTMQEQTFRLSERLYEDFLREIGER